MKSIFKRIIKKLNINQHGNFYKINEEDKKLISDIHTKKLTYLPNDRLASIAETCQSIENQKLPGVMIEAGCALGGSAILIQQIKNSKRLFCIYDVFGMIPAPTKEDGADVQKRYQTIFEGKSKGIQGDRYYGYETNLYKIVEDNLKKFGTKEKRQNVKLIKGLLQKTMKIDKPVCFAHIDVDWYDPVFVSLERIIPKLVVGGSVILDDYNDWSGCRKATDEYFKNISSDFIMDDSAGSLKITRIKI